MNAAPERSPAAGSAFSAIEAVKEIVGGTGKKYYIQTFGCQQNEADSERVAGMCEEMGYSRSGSPEEADLIVVNTCAVREHAEKRALSVIGQYKHLKKGPCSPVIAVCGCMVSQGHRADQLKKSYPYVDFSFGTSDLQSFPELLLGRLSGGPRRFAMPPERPLIAEGIPVRRESSFRAWLSIMYGCDNFCSYCIVPYVRGRERSRDVEAVIEESRGLIATGCRDITLLGQNVNSYGRGLPYEISFSDLLERIDAIDGDYLIRFMTSHPKDATKRIADVMAASRHIAHQYHLPAQSGSDAVLEAMNRGYTSEAYIAKADYIREKMPDVALTTDIMVGFPGETDKDFEDTLRLLEKVRFDGVYSFIYSPRKGTPAAEDPDQVPEKVKSERMEALLALQTDICAEKNASLVGKKMRVLVYGESAQDPRFVECRTEGGKLMHIPADSGVRPGEFVFANVVSAGAFRLSGEIAGGKG